MNAPYLSKTGGLEVVTTLRVVTTSKVLFSPAIWRGRVGVGVR